MPWNPDVYDQFKQERSAPYFDLIKLVEIESNMSVVDLGCGTGEPTAVLLDLIPNSQIIGIDSSGEMLQKAEQFETKRLQFFKRSVEEQMELDEKFDLIIANASLQWCQNHQELFPKLISKINLEGQLAVQVPSNHNFIVHQLLSVVAEHDFYQKHFNGWKREYSVLNIEDYAKILSDNGGRKINVFEKVYPHIMKDADAVYDWASGTAMIPFVEKLPEELKEQYKQDYKKELRKVFRGSPVFYPFKRTFIYAQF
ncbi:methyltransferase domain-containing protein [Epilithonimonas zeae]|uniref:Trans-aconitate 2-methyltransferase n=1 Tax=Epilithonimonas zeae TaxID=1416779 RepID=A0A1N6EDA9_9FLAO|nr:methyltransferase domain-containing protein [Epilithonimonas zeae]SIN81004.1 trans-aconitate 2-methyltransferase [Epilithonimonas zeae]